MPRTKSTRNKIIARAVRDVQSQSPPKPEIVRAILETSTKVNSSFDLERVLNSNCQTAVELLGVDHSRFVEFSEDLNKGRVSAEFPGTGMVGDIIPLDEMPASEEFIRAQKPLIVSDVACAQNLGSGREILLNRGIRSTLIVPVIGTENRLWGSFSLDSIGKTRSFTNAEIEACKIFADQFAVALESSAQHQKTRQPVVHIESLWRAALSHAATFDRNASLITIIQQAVALLSAKSGGIYEYNSERERLTVIADFNRQQNVGKNLRKGEGMAGRLIQSNEPYMIIDDYDAWKGRSRSYSRGRRFRAVIEVPLIWQARTVGVLYVDDKIGRKFTPKEARMLGLFADQAALLLVNAEILTKDSERLTALTNLSKATAEIIQSLGRIPLEELLTLVAKFATQILRAESCGVFLASTTGYLSLDASYGHREGGFEKGRKLRIDGGPHTGLTGYIAYHGDLFNKHGSELTEHPAVRGKDLYHTPSGKCHSILAIPLKKKGASEDQLVGLLRIDNKKNRYDQPSAGLAFTPEDEWILGIFAETVVVAIERSMFFDQIGKQKDNWTRFLDSAATGIIASDARGNVTFYNKQAEQILGYPAVEVLYSKVSSLYFNPQEPRKIGNLLKKDPGNKLTNYETFVRSKEGKRIPIRLSATQLFDEHGEAIGSVGYFDRATTEIHTLLVKASEIISKAESPTEGLQKIAEMILSLIPHTFCRILLFDDDKKSLHVEAAHRIPRSCQESGWKNRFTNPLIPSQWKGLETIINKGRPEVIQLSEDRFKANLTRLSRVLGFSGNIQSLLVIPITIEKERVGFVELGEERSHERTSFPQREVGWIAKVAAQVTMLIMMSLYRITNRHKGELEHLHRSATAMVGALELKAVLETIVDQARNMLGATSSVIWSYDSCQDRFIPEEMVAAGIPLRELRRLRNQAPQPGRTAYTVLRKTWIEISNVESTTEKFVGPTTRAFLKRIKVTSFQGIALKAGDEPVGVLYVNYRQPRTFKAEDRATLENFAAYAALSLKRARLHTQLTHAKSTVTTVTKLMALGNQKVTLDSVIKGTFKVLQCDAVTLYAYDQSRKRFLYPPTVHELRDPAGVERFKELPKESIVYTILRRHRPYIAEKIREHKLFENRKFVTREGIESCAAIPLRASGQKVGVMFVNYRTRHRFTGEELESINLFAAQAAVALSNAQLYEQSRRRAEVLDGLNNTGRVVTRSLSLQKSLELIAQQALIILGIGDEEARCFSHVLLRAGDDLYFMAASSPRATALLKRRLPKINLTGASTALGIVGRAANTKTTQNVGNVKADPDYHAVSMAIHSQLSVPLKVGRRVIGVLSIEHPALNAFSSEDLKNVESLAAQAAIAIENAQHHEQLQHLHQAATSMAGAFGLKQVTHTVARCAQEMLEANSCVIWPYDHVHDQFIPEQTWATGIADSELERLKREEPEPGRTAYTILKRGWIGVPNLSDAEFLGNSTREFLRRIKVASFQGIALEAGDEPVGVLYVNYKEQRTFTENDRHALENFASYAALSLKGARLLDQVKKASTAAEIVAYQTALGDWDASLETITGATVELLDSNASILYVYDPTTRKLKHPPTNIGLRNPDSVRHGAGIAENSIVYEMLRKSEPYKVENISEDPIFKNSRFAREEGIVSAVAIPLGMSEQKLGVMFVNYRRHRTFTEEEIKRIQLYAVQAAVAISNAQLYHASQSRGQALEGLHNAGRRITSSLDRKPTLQAITRQALGIIGPDKRKGSFSHLALKSGNMLDFIASSSKRILKVLHDQSLRDPHRTGIAGVVARDGESLRVSNVAENKHYVAVNDKVKSQLSVPLRIGKKTIGVLSIEHSDLDAFTVEDQKNIELLAAQAAIAVDHARQFKDLRDAKGFVGSLTALAWMGMASNVSRHEIESYASTMKIALKQLRRQFQNVQLKPKARKDIEERLQTLDTQTSNILSEQFPPPLSNEEGVELFMINELINDRIKVWRENELLPSIRTSLRLTNDDTTILCNNEWLGIAFNILIDNAVKAMAKSRQRALTITTRTKDNKVQVIFRDTGKGIPRRIRPKLFRERIQRPGGKGWGKGLLMLPAIVQAFDGEAKVAASGAEGTTMVLSFPHRTRRLRPKK